MKPEEQRIAIAEYCGFHHCHISSIPNRYFNWAHRNDSLWTDWKRNDQEGVACPTHDLPDYLNDLNAMHEAEKLFTQNERSAEYVHHLNSMCCIWHATAAQKAKAFLLTLGKWTE